MLQGKWGKLAFLMCLSMLASQEVTAQSSPQSSFYAGVEIGHANLSFKPHYRFVNGAPDVTFDNQADGSMGGILAGYHWKSGKDYSLDLEGLLSASNASWQMALPEPASFRYDVPMNLSVSLLPSFHLTDKFAVFAQAGLALGRIRERKSAVSTSMYDVNEWRPGIVAGFGMRLTLDDRWSMRIGYRRTRYQNHEFATYLANGSQVEAVTSRVEQSATTLSLVKEF